MMAIGASEIVIMFAIACVVPLGAVVVFALTRSRKRKSR